MALTDYIKNTKIAMRIAKEAHEGIFRRGKDSNGNKIPYIAHPIEVSNILRAYKDSEYMHILVPASILHDVPEDSDITADDILKEYEYSDDGYLIVSIVEELTSSQEEIERIGKEQHLKEKTLGMSTWALGIKLSDRLHNLSDLLKKLAGNGSDIKWAIKYATQTKNILDNLSNRKLTKTHIKLINKIRQTIEPALC
jgi:(p)ppGpp synthase/HD superfamily hydrolase